MTPEIVAEYPFDHAGQGETSLMMALCPEAVDMRRFEQNKGWYTASAKHASPALGGKARDMILAHLRGILKG
jgi:creatinine amidohydrolase/Fe(II)-dependent formamide hydrolase-like protein